MSLCFAEERPFDAQARDLIPAIGGQCAQVQAHACARSLATGRPQGGGCASDHPSAMPCCPPWIAFSDVLH